LCGGEREERKIVDFRKFTVCVRVAWRERDGWEESERESARARAREQKREEEKERTRKTKEKKRELTRERGGFECS